MTKDTKLFLLTYPLIAIANISMLKYGIKGAEKGVELCVFLSLIPLANMSIFGVLILMNLAASFFYLFGYLLDWVR